ncbi:MAG TPA: bifunctional 5,10-methylenetetrahydrofolate dehydrogenase/5,10-methenyltetrahydrofolate cyclohydrolase, partial [Kofleriaceae bacterium]|nr:bifunctional 5,10-methylenetetrahydrofolate dehydrogenase/5,10-methenyltetrahydrofolate cyclohydrolase [Kofleriaceae bacterium]
MAARVLDGKALAARVRAEVAGQVAELAARGVVPGLHVVLVGDDPASQIYVRNKGKAASEAGIRAVDHRYPVSVTQAELLDLVARLNADPSVHGILVQLPLPAHVDALAVQDAVTPAKDVDGFHPENLGLLAQGRPRYVSATPRGCMRLLREAGIRLAGAHAVVVGRSNIVGKPMAMLLTNESATVCLCHSRTADLADQVGRADVVVAAVGKAELVRGAWIKPGAVVIDVGINRTAEGKLLGDVEFAGAAARAAAITPV